MSERPPRITRRDAMAIMASAAGGLATPGTAAPTIAGREAPRSAPTWREAADLDAELASLYAPLDGAPLWLDAQGVTRPAAWQALTALAGCASDALDPADYAAEELDRRARQLPAAERAERTAFDLALSRSMLRLLRHLDRGRVDPRQLDLRLPARAARLDGPVLLRQAAQADRVPSALEAARPASWTYRRLREVLPEWRDRAGREGPVPQIPPSRTVRQGDRGPLVPWTRQRLQAYGELALQAPLDGAASPGDVFDADLADAVSRFQSRHGLDTDGAVGRTTTAALAVPLSHRVRQIEWAMERLRWLPPRSDEPLVAINIPMFRLWSVDAQGQPGPGMKIVAGKALRTQTPVFSDEMRYLVFGPYWNVPPSIAVQELLPTLVRDAGYLERQGMELVSGPGDDAQPVSASPENLERLRRGELRLRQRPGRMNALGAVKFIFPNDANVYLHDTPATKLFERSRRDFSHGCVRLEKPAALAKWLLREKPGWDAQAVEQAMQESHSRRVDLPRPVPVVLFYVTALVWPEDGSLHFAEDFYGHDARLERALRGVRAAQGDPTAMQQPVRA